MTAVSGEPISLSIERPALYVIATPIGNLSDVSYRAVATLKAVDLVLAEDTRVSLRLLQRYAITTPVRPLHDHNESEIADKVLARAREERLAIGLLTDAGTPLIADPGFRLVRAAHAANLGVYVVPGPCAAIAAVSIAGLPTDRFAFEGFLPPRTNARRKRLGDLSGDARTLVFYEAPHRLIECIDDFCATFGRDREVVIARELTKVHETLYRGPLGDVAEAISADPNAARGEIVIVVAGAPASEEHDNERRALHMIPVLTQHLSRAQAIKVAAEITGAKRNRLYALIGHGLQD